MRLGQTAGASRAVFDRLPSRRLLLVVQAFGLLITVIHGRDDNALSKRLDMLCVRDRRLDRRIKPSNVEPGRLLAVRDAGVCPALRTGARTQE